MDRLLSPRDKPDQVRAVAAPRGIPHAFDTRRCGMARLFACVIVFSVLLIAAELGAQTSNNGVSVCAETADQGSAQVIANGAGGALVTWQDRRRGNYDIYVQRIGPDGAPVWTP